MAVHPEVAPGLARAALGARYAEIRATTVGLAAPLSLEDELVQMFGDVWEWTASAYLPYPRFRLLEGELGSTTASSCPGRWCCVVAPA